MEALRIILGSVLAAITYGILQDQVTARVCVEYFTVGHPNLFGTDSPTLLAFGWGVVATWWAGLILGIALAVAARAGSRPKLRANNLFPAVCRLLLYMGAIAAVSGVVGYLAAESGLIQLADEYASSVPPERHSLFLADGAAHLAAYVTGFVGGLLLCIRTWARRKRLSTRPDNAEQRRDQ